MDVLLYRAGRNIVFRKIVYKHNAGRSCGHALVSKLCRTAQPVLWPLIPVPQSAAAIPSVGRAQRAAARVLAGERGACPWSDAQPHASQPHAALPACGAARGMRPALLQASTPAAH